MEGSTVVEERPRSHRGMRDKEANEEHAREERPGGRQERRSGEEEGACRGGKTGRPTWERRSGGERESGQGGGGRQGWVGGSRHGLGGRREASRLGSCTCGKNIEETI